HFPSISPAHSSALFGADANVAGGSILLAHNPPKWVNFACRFTVLGDLQAGGVLSTELAQRIAVALPDILEEYAYYQGSLPVPSMAELPTVRQQVHRLSGLLKGKFPVLADVHSRLKLDPLPEVRDIRADPAE
ncbi:hypothetical protein, partial [Roseovarius dicentrarchi]|uniref:hypothetical protein n=1 Tax=Roseovarius dicentrarchi TaxID=2250573 RepID=UPI0019396EFA